MSSAPPSRRKARHMTPLCRVWEACGRARAAAERLCGSQLPKVVMVVPAIRCGSGRGVAVGVLSGIRR
jgi:hypothetical protein